MMTLILLRGLSRQSHHWQDFPRRLKQDLGLERVLTLDLPGFGNQSHLEFPTTIEAIIKNLNMQLEQYEIIESAFLIGLSMGGMIAIHWASLNPEKFRAVSAINSSFTNLSPFHWRIKPKGFVYLLGALLAPTPKVREQLILNITSNRIWLGDSPIVDWIQIDKRHPLKLIQVYRQLRFSSKLKAPEKLPIPLLVLSSIHDKLVSYRCSEKIAQYYNATIFLNPSAGHDLPLDDPTWILNSIKSFISTSLSI